MERIGGPLATNWIPKQGRFDSSSQIAPPSTRKSGTLDLS